MTLLPAFACVPARQGDCHCDHMSADHLCTGSLLPAGPRAPCAHPPTCTSSSDASGAGRRPAGAGSVASLRPSLLHMGAVAGRARQVDEALPGVWDGLPRCSCRRRQEQAPGQEAGPW